MIPLWCFWWIFCDLLVLLIFRLVFIGAFLGLIHIVCFVDRLRFLSADFHGGFGAMMCC